MNVYKAKFVRYALVRALLHNSLTLCNWMWPMAVSPLKERKYRGDTALEAKFYSLVTGIAKTKEELDRDSERAFTLWKQQTAEAQPTDEHRDHRG